MLYIHSKEELEIPEGGMCTPNSEDCTHERTSSGASFNANESIRMQSKSTSRRAL